MRRISVRALASSILTALIERPRRLVYRELPITPDKLL
jgi:hypothetical protein